MHFLACGPVLTDERGILMDYTRAKFGDRTFSRFDFIDRPSVRTNTQLHTDAAKRLPHAPVVGGSNTDSRRIGQRHRHS